MTDQDKSRWIPITERLPEDESYILVSFENTTMPDIARYEEDGEGGRFYPGDDEDPYTSYGIIVNAWMPLPEPYRGEQENTECIETPKISKRDRAFLEYIKAPYKYIARDMKGDIYAYKDKPTKTIDVWNLGGVPMYVSWFEVDFPVVKWEDEEPWLIEDLKKLEVVEEYESN